MIEKLCFQTGDNFKVWQLKSNYREEHEAVKEISITLEGIWIDFFKDLLGDYFFSY